MSVTLSVVFPKDTPQWVREKLEPNISDPESVASHYLFKGDREVLVHVELFVELGNSDSFLATVTYEEEVKSDKNGNWVGGVCTEVYRLYKKDKLSTHLTGW